MATEWQNKKTPSKNLVFSYTRQVYKPSSVFDNHLSRPIITNGLQRYTPVSYTHLINDIFLKTYLHDVNIIFICFLSLSAKAL